MQKKIVEIISHEFAHMLQYRDVLAQYGEQGLREIVMNDKSIPANQKEATIRKVLDSDYTKNLLDNFNKLQHSETGSLNEYITRIYKDELANPVAPDVDMQGYVDQVTEREAYNLGSERLGNRTQDLDQIEVKEDWTKNQGFTTHKTSNGVEIRIYDDGTIEKINSNVPKGILETIKEYEYPWITKKIDTLIKKMDLNLSNEDKANIHYLFKEFRKNDIKYELGEYDISSIIQYLKRSGENYDKNDIDKVVTFFKKFSGYNPQSLFRACYSKHDTCYITPKDIKVILDNFKDLPTERICAILSDYSKKPSVLSIVYDYIWTDDALEVFKKTLPLANKLEITTLKNLIEISNLTQKNYISTLTTKRIKEKITELQKITEKEKNIFKTIGIDIDNIINQLDPVITGFDVKTDKIRQNNFLKSIIGNNNPKNEKIITSDKFKNYLTNLEKSGSALLLKYPREDFVKDLKTLLSQLPESEQKEVLKHLNIEINENGFTVFIKLDDFEYKNFDSATHTTLKEIKSKVDDFILNNETKIPDPEIKEVLDNLIKGFPEFTSILGRVDADHVGKLEIHTLQVLAEALSNPDYKNLSNFEKTMLKFSILMHDIGKLEGQKSPHGEQSAIYARSILDKFKLSNGMKEGIVNLIKYHHSINSGAFYYIFRNSAQQNVAKVLGESDFIARFKFNKSSQIEGEPLKGLANYLDKEINHNKHLSKYPRKTYTLENGKKVSLRILDLTKGNYNDKATQYGWYGDKSLGETLVQVHNCYNNQDKKAVDNIKNIIVGALNPNKEMVLSTTVTKLLALQKNGYGNISIILSTPKGNNVVIDSQSASNASGLKKDPSKFITESANDANYQKQFNLGEVNEVLSLNPNIEQIALKGVSPENVPLDIIELLSKYDIPLLLLP